MRTTEVPVELIDLGSHIPFKCFTSKSHCHRTRKCRYTLRPNLTSTGSGKITHVADEIYAYLSDIANYIQENYLTPHWNTNNIVFIIIIIIIIYFLLLYNVHGYFLVISYTNDFYKICKQVFYNTMIVSIRK